MKDLYIEKYQILLTEFKDDPNNERWEYICVHGLEDLILFKWQYSPNWATDSIQAYQSLALFLEKLTK